MRQRGFMIDIEEAINLIEYGLDVDGFNVIPNLKSFYIKDLFDIFASEFGLEYSLGVPRISEKLHEMMISKEETPRTFYDKEKNTFFMHYKDLAKDAIDLEFTSDISVVSKKELYNILKEYNFFKGD